MWEEFEMLLFEKFKVLRDLKHIRRLVMQDGRIDIDEANFILKYVEPIAKKKNFHVRYFSELLKRANENGKISAYESSEISEALDNTIYFMRVEAWFPILIASFVVALSIAIAL